TSPVDAMSKLSFCDLKLQFTRRQYLPIISLLWSSCRSGVLKTRLSGVVLVI
ncbi:hypothetical protein AVEN_10401-1, partial [Araneus ventricosus]